MAVSTVLCDDEIQIQQLFTSDYSSVQSEDIAADVLPFVVWWASW